MAASTANRLVNRLGVELHRVVLVGTLALLAFGVARADRQTVAAGLAAWAATLVGALLGVR